MVTAVGVDANNDIYPVAYGMVIKIPILILGSYDFTILQSKNDPDPISIIIKIHGKTARGRSPDISYFYVFGCPVHIHNHRDHLAKFDEKADDGFFLGYSPIEKAFRVLNIRREEMEETFHVTFSEDDEAISQTKHRR
ncbi:hypothetical protein Tco_0980911 [Tanacetum coccineum]